MLIENPLNETIMLSVVGAVQAFSTASAEYVLEPYQVLCLGYTFSSLGNDRQPNRIAVLAILCLSGCAHFAGFACFGFRGISLNCTTCEGFALHICAVTFD